MSAATSSRVWLTCAFWLCSLCVVGADPVMEVVKAPRQGTNLLRNADFEESSGSRAQGWEQQPSGFTLITGAGRGGSRALYCAATNGSGSFGAGQTISFDSGSLEPLVLDGWSKAQDVSGSSDSGYSLYVDILYEDGTPLWGQTANFSTGTHDWEHRQLVLVPDKPIKRLSVYCLFRGHVGKVWFDELRLEQLKAAAGAVTFQGVAVTVPHARRPAGRSQRFKTQDGLELALSGNGVTSIQISGRDLAASAPSGFMVRDVAANSDVFGFTNGACSELALRLKTQVDARADHIVLSGRVTDTSGRDRSVTLIFALPLEATGWRWGDDIRHSRPIQGNAEFCKTVRVGCGATGTMSLYPLAALYDERQGLALAIDMGQPALYRLVYHAGTKQFFIAYDFGLSPDTQRFPAGADFRFVLFRFDPRWGFRSAFQKLTQIFPEYFQVRSPDQGIWMPFTDVSTVQGWQDFGFKYHEGNNNPAWDAAHGILAFRYTEPMTWWMPMPKDAPRTAAEVLRLRDQLAANPKAAGHDLALVSQIAAMWDDRNQPVFQFRNEPWCHGAVWSLNPNPYLSPIPNPTSNPSLPPLNAATVHWNDSIKSKLYRATKAPLAGEYLDSLEGYTTADLNFRREHFRDTSVPLVFDTETKKTALYKGLAVYEFTRWFCDDVHRLGKLTFANGVPYRLTFLCPWLDVLGTETDWLSAGKYRPASEPQMNLWRTMASRKPYLLLMNTDYDRFTPDLVERYFQRSLFYGMFPSMFSHNAAENQYWQNPKWYNRDRPLFVKYLPLIKRIAEAGWQPVTGVDCDNSRIWVERFGPAANGTVYLTLFNDTGTEQSGRLDVELAELHLPPSGKRRDLLTGQQWQGDLRAIHVTLPSQHATALALERD